MMSPEGTADPPLQGARADPAAAISSRSTDTVAPRKPVGSRAQARPKKVAKETKKEKEARQAALRSDRFGPRATSVPAAAGGRSTLEGLTLLNPVADELFNIWLGQMGLTASTEKETLTFFLDYLDCLFWAGADHSDGSKTLAALQHFLPSLATETALLARVCRALSGWAKRCPAGARNEVAWEGIMAIVGDLLHRRKEVHAVAVLVALKCYFRPGETMSLLPQELLSPMGSSSALKHWCILLHSTHRLNAVGSNTNKLNESIVVEHPRFPECWQISP